MFLWFDGLSTGYLFWIFLKSLWNLIHFIGSSCPKIWKLNKNKIVLSQVDLSGAENMTVINLQTDGNGTIQVMVWLVGLFFSIIYFSKL